MLHLAYEVGKLGGILPTIYNASNEAAVNLFLDGKISFREIESIILKYTLSADNILNPTLEEILEVDKAIKQKIYNAYNKE
jgi:1-deoxy-D-xylulose-5-phosphate reductoisomerase